jgi:hypothetical protein
MSSESRERPVYDHGVVQFTKAAEEKNAENLLIVKSEELAGMYSEN